MLRHFRRADEFCQVCMSPIKMGQNRIKLKCQHDYHYGCFITMIKLDDELSLNSCIICKKGLGVQYYRFETETQMEKVEGTCPICIEEYGYEKDVITTDCNHRFHTICIKKWFRRNNTCPMCRVRNENVDISEDVHEVGVTSQISNRNRSYSIYMPNISLSSNSAPPLNIQDSISSMDNILGLVNFNELRMAYQNNRSEVPYVGITMIDILDRSGEENIPIGITGRSVRSMIVNVESDDSRSVIGVERLDPDEEMRLSVQSPIPFGIVGRRVNILERVSLLNVPTDDEADEDIESVMMDSVD